jgi:hypothetical protein
LSAALLAAGSFGCVAFAQTVGKDSSAVFGVTAGGEFGASFFAHETFLWFLRLIDE